MSKINVIIPQQNFELVRNRIAEILIDEIGNQFILTGNYEIDAEVTIEDSRPVDKIDCPLVSVSTIKGDYDAKAYNGNVPGVYTFAIDVFTNAKTTEENIGSVISMFKCQRLIGIVRYILEDPQYKTLGFTPGFIARVMFNGFEFSASSDKDALNTSMGRLTVTVHVTETTSLISPTIAAGYDTKVKIGNSNNGYAYITENYN